MDSSRWEIDWGYPRQIYAIEFRDVEVGGERGGKAGGWEYKRRRKVQNGRKGT